MNKTSVCILDYGSGNVGSVHNLLSTITENALISNNKSDIKKASHIVLPGVGAFGASMQKILKLLPLAFIKDEVFNKKKPFLGICVGMQVLADVGFEFGEHKGLGWIPGRVRMIDSGKLSIPHIGWNDVSINQDSPLTAGFEEKPDFYFVHSYILVPKNTDYIVGATVYNEDFCSILRKENIYGVQFHPEKSQKAGKKLLENFLNIK